MSKNNEDSLTWLELMNKDGLIWKFIYGILFTIAVVLADIHYDTLGWVMVVSLFPSFGFCIAIIYGGFYKKWKDYKKELTRVEEIRKTFK